MMLYVAADNRAKNLYQRSGYQITEHEDGACISYCAVGIRVGHLSSFILYTQYVNIKKLKKIKLKFNNRSNNSINRQILLLN